MALLLQSSCLIHNPHRLHLSNPHRHFSSLTAKPSFTVSCQDSSKVSSNPTSINNNEPTSSESPTIDSSPLSKKPMSSGQGFGSNQSTPNLNTSSQIPKKKQKGNGERASVVRRRAPVQRPAFLDKQNEEQVKEQAKNESSFLLTWLGLGVIILAQGIALAASGFLPDEWDKWLVKYLYPTFTPTVALFVAGTVVYGVVKYLQNENLNNKS